MTLAGVVSGKRFALGFPGGSVVRNLPASEGDRVRPRVRKIPWRRKWQPIPVFLLGKSHGQRSLVGYLPRGHKESDTTERLNDNNSK